MAPRKRVVNSDSESEGASQPVRGGRNVKDDRERKPLVPNSASPEIQENENDEELDFEFDMTPAPLSRDIVIRKLANFTTEWNTVEKFMMEGLEAIGTAAVDAEEFGKEDVVQELDNEWRSLSDKLAAIQGWKNAVSSLRMRFANNEIITDPSLIVEEQVEKEVKDWMKKTEIQKYRKSEKYRNFRQGIHEVNNSGIAMGPVKTYLPRADDEQDSDSDLEIGGSTQNFKCPITLQDMTDAVRSRKCGHAYSRQGIFGLVRESGSGGTQCPVAGCDKTIKATDLETDESLSRRVREHLRREDGRRKMGATQFQRLEDSSEDEEEQEEARRRARVKSER